MSIERGRAYFRQFGMEDRVIEFTVSSATVELAAKALGVEGARIAKTLSFKKPEGGALLILAAGDARIDNHKFKEKFHFKAKMPTPDEVLELIGHPVGGVCPFGINEGREPEALRDRLPRRRQRRERHRAEPGRAVEVLERTRVDRRLQASRINMKTAAHMGGGLFMPRCRAPRSLSAPP